MSFMSSGGRALGKTGHIAGRIARTGGMGLGIGIAGAGAGYYAGRGRSSATNGLSSQNRSM